MRFVSSIRGVFIFLPPAASTGLMANAAADAIKSFRVSFIAYPSLESDAVEPIDNTFFFSSYT